VIVMKSQLFRASARIQRAVNFKFASLKRGVCDEAVRRLLLALSNLQEQSHDLPPDLSALYYSAESGETEISNWGPFNLNGEDFNSATIGPHTAEDIETFQYETRALEPDGMAGMNTLPRIDKIVAYLESRGPLKPFRNGGAFPT